MTPAKSYRLGAETEADIERLAKHLGIKSHAEVMRLAIRRMARTELGEGKAGKASKGKGKT